MRDAEGELGAPCYLCKDRMQSHCTGFNSQGMVGGDIRREGVGNRENWSRGEAYQAQITCRPVRPGLLLRFVEGVSLTRGRPLAPLPLLVAHPCPPVAQLPSVAQSHCPLCISGSLDTGWLLASSIQRPPPCSTDRPAKTAEVAFKH